MAWGARVRCYTYSTIGPLWDFTDRIVFELQLFKVVAWSLKIISRIPKSPDSGSREDLTVVEKLRARRFAMQVPVRYRVSDGSEWRKGITENISYTGVLFRGEEFAPPDTPVEMSLALPREICGVHSAQVVCKGKVVRAEQPQEGAEFPSLASTILRYRFVRA